MVLVDYYFRRLIDSLTDSFIRDEYPSIVNIIYHLRRLGFDRRRIFLPRRIL